MRNETSQAANRKKSDRSSLFTELMLPNPKQISANKTVAQRKELAQSILNEFGFLADIGAAFQTTASINFPDQSTPTGILLEASTTKILQENPLEVLRIAVSAANTAYQQDKRNFDYRNILGQVLTAELPGILPAFKDKFSLEHLIALSDVVSNYPAESRTALLCYNLRGLVIMLNGDVSPADLRTYGQRLSQHHLALRNEYQEEFIKDRFIERAVLLAQKAGNTSPQIICKILDDAAELFLSCQQDKGKQLVPELNHFLYFLAKDYKLNPSSINSAKERLLKAGEDAPQFLCSSIQWIQLQEQHKHIPPIRGQSAFLDETRKRVKILKQANDNITCEDQNFTDTVSTNLLHLALFFQRSPKDLLIFSTAFKNLLPLESKKRNAAQKVLEYLARSASAQSVKKISLEITRRDGLALAPHTYQHFLSASFSVPTFKSFFDFEDKIKKINKLAQDSGIPAELAEKMSEQICFVDQNPNIFYGRNSNLKIAFKQILSRLDLLINELVLNPSRIQGAAIGIDLKDFSQTYNCCQRLATEIISSPSKTN